MLLDFNQFDAFICPVCTSINITPVNIFDFSGNKNIILKCNSEHRERCVFIEEKKDKYKIAVKCPICNEPHDFSIKKSTFWKCKFFSFRCPLSDIEIYFHGNIQKVDEALKAQEEMLNEYNNDISYTDEEDVLIDNIIYHLHLLLANDAVNCICGNSNIGLDIDDDSIILFCEKCGKIKRLPINEKTLYNITNTNCITLD